MIDQVAELESHRDSLASRLTSDERRIKSLAEQKKHATRTLALTTARKLLLFLAVALRKWCDEQGVPRFLLALCLPVPCVSLAFIVGGRIFVFLVGAASVIASAFLWFVPDDQRLRMAQAGAAEKCDGLRETLAKLDADTRNAESNIARLRDQLAIAETQFASATQTRDYRLAKLFSRRWKEMRGSQFEDFLAEVFHELGYEVEQTGQSGDQGVDLIAERQGQRIAIQAKGYVDSVGNAAVQQAYTGKAFYSCHSCAVITNSRFTTSAQEAAAKVDCILINEENFEDFVMGRMLLG